MRLVGFLRSLSVGGGAVSMEHLRMIFEAAGFTSLETFGESGNIVFDGDDEDLLGLERVIEQMLKEALGSDVPIFLRTDVELRAIVKHTPFTPEIIKAAAAVKGGGALNVAMFKDRLDQKATSAIMALKNPKDDFSVRGREVYWLSWQKQGAISSALLEIAAGGPAALRGMTTMADMAKRFRPKSFEKADD